MVYNLSFMAETSPEASSIFSTTYFSIGWPPSSAGGFQLSLQPSAWTLDTLSGPPGGLGLSDKQAETYHFTHFW
jgi:hypothetical protein